MFKAIIGFITFVFPLITIFLRKIIYSLVCATSKNRSAVFHDPLVRTPITQNDGWIENVSVCSNKLGSNHV